MALFRIFPNKDAFITSEKPTSNTGLDEILEVGNYRVGGTNYKSRALLSFSDEDLGRVRSLSLGNDLTSNLKLFVANAESIPTSYTLESYPLLGSWDNGTGRYNNVPTVTDGISWETRVGFDTGSVSGSVSYGITHTHDVTMDISSIVDTVFSDPSNNHGIVVKVSDDLESDLDTDFRLKYFSSDTGTVHPPYLECGWNDFVRETGSLSEVDTTEVVYNINNRSEYINEGKQRFRLTVRPKFPIRTFSTESAYLTNHILPEESYWGIQDYYNGVMVCDFGEFTKISCDEKGNHFDVYFEGIQPERYYKVLVKTTIDGSELVLDDDVIFKVVQNV